MPETTWPEGVVARYLTVGGATVEVKNPHAEVTGVATCGGCHDNETFEIVPYNCAGGGVHAAKSNAEYACGWAQAHAAICRAMPRPTA